MKNRLIEIEWPDFGEAKLPPSIPAEEFLARLKKIRILMDDLGFTHFVIYGDREHFANIQYACGLDPRFEEALLIVGEHDKPLIIVGNECKGYLGISSLYRSGHLRKEVFPFFSLAGQPREKCRKLRDIFAGEGIGLKSRVGCVGLKYYTDKALRMPTHAVDIPSYITDIIRSLAGPEMVLNVTDTFIHPEYGLRSTCSVNEIAFMEYSNLLASRAMKRMIFGLKEGMTDFEACALLGYNGMPLCCHPTFVTGATRNIGLSGPVGAVIKKGEPFAANFGYWGSNICRAGWLVQEAKELPGEAADYIENFAGPYFEAMGEWFKILKPGTAGAELHNAIYNNLPHDKFGIELNAGHLIHMDEWTDSPIFAGSKMIIRSGMVFQSDVIPVSEKYFSARIEDGYLLADLTLQRELKEQYPECFARCLARRNFMVGTLKYELSEEVLPLSDMCGIMPPFVLRPSLVFAFER